MIKRILWIIIILLLSISNSFAESVNIDKIIAIESSGNPWAFNEDSDAWGLMQITPICLKEWNNRNEKQYTSEDLCDPDINRKIGTWYMNIRIPAYLCVFDIEDTIENRLIAYNWGIGNLRKYKSGSIKSLPYETKNYIKKYMEV